MPGTPTPILGLAVPTVGGDYNAWGGELNGDLAIIDNLGAASVVSVSAGYAASPNTFPETIIRVTTGASAIPISLPIPASCPGKIFTVKKVDAGVGSIVITPASGAIDGSPTWTIDDQYSFVRLLSTGTTYDVIGLL